VCVDGAVLDGFTVTGGEGEFGGGVDAGNYEITIDNSIIRDNFASGFPSSQGGGGVLCSGPDCRLTIVRSQIISNSVGEGASGIRVGEGMLVMTNSIVADNAGAEGLHLNGAANLMNVTIAGNGTDVGRPGINYNPQVSEQLIIVNSILYGNGDAIHVPDMNMVQVSYSDIQGGWDGTNNIDVDPLFVDPANGDYHLTSDSPAMDAGISTGAPNHDFEDDPRPLFNGVDMGADEVTTITGEMPATGGDITTPDSVILQFPAGTFSEDVIVSYTLIAPMDTGNLVGPGVFYELEAVYTDDGMPATIEPGASYTITIPYDESALPQGVEEADLALYYWDGSDWVKEPTSVVDTIANTITATPDHFSLWSALVETDTLAPTVVKIFPADQTTDITLNASIIVTFSEPISQTSLSLTLLPDPGGLATTWNDAGTVVTASHADFAEDTLYTATVMANDAADNAMTTPLSWTFTTLTEGYEVYLPLILR